MIPFIQIFNQRVYAFNCMLAVVLLAIALLAVSDCKKLRQSSRQETLLLAVIPIFTLIGAASAVASDYLFRGPTENLGATFMGWLSGSLLVIFAYSHLFMKSDKMFMFNFYLPSFALAQAFGRIGCFLAGCCHGRPCALGFSYPVGSIPYGVYGDARLLPVQLLEASYLFVVFYVCRQRVAFNFRGGAYLLLLGAGRFLFEFLRGDFRGSFLGATAVSPAQALSLCAMILGL